jgi:hypothetical protein
MQILVTPSDIIKRCLWLEYKRFCLKDKKEEELKSIVFDDSPIILKEEDAYVIGFLKVVETPNLVHRFKDHIEEYLKIKSFISNNRLYIKLVDILKEVSTFKECFPDYFNPPFEYKKGIDDLKNFIDKIYPEIEKLTIIKLPNKEGKIIDHVSSNSVKSLLYPKTKDKPID